MKERLVRDIACALLGVLCCTAEGMNTDNQTSSRDTTSNQSSNVQVRLPSYLREVEEHWYRNWTYFHSESIVIPNTVLVIGDDAFRSSKTLKQVEFEPNSSLRRIGEGAFRGTAIESITIPRSVDILGDFVFGGCRTLKQVMFEPNSSLYTIGEHAFGRTAVESIIIPRSVRKIGKNAFFNCKALKQVEFEPNSKLRVIGRSAFFSSDIESIVIPSSVTKIEGNAFTLCKSLKQVRFEGNSQLVELDASAFESCPLEQVIIPSTLKEVALSAFAGKDIKIIQSDEDPAPKEEPLELNSDGTGGVISTIPAENNVEIK